MRRKQIVLILAALTLCCLSGCHKVRNVRSVMLPMAA